MIRVASALFAFSLLSGCSSFSTVPDAFYVAQQEVAVAKIKAMSEPLFVFDGTFTGRITSRVPIPANAIQPISEGSHPGKVVSDVLAGPMLPWYVMGYAMREGLRQAGDIEVNGDGNHLVNDFHQNSYADGASSIWSPDDNRTDYGNFDATTPQQVVTPGVVQVPTQIVDPAVVTQQVVHPQVVYPQVIQVPAP